MATDDGETLSVSVNDDISLISRWVAEALTMGCQCHEALDLEHFDRCDSDPLLEAAPRDTKGAMAILGNLPAKALQGFIVGKTHFFAMPMVPMVKQISCVLTPEYKPSRKNGCSYGRLIGRRRCFLMLFVL